MNVFYRCEHCKAVWMMMQGKEKKMTCCDEKVKPLIPGVVDAAVEKHIPVVEVKSNMVNVSVGNVMHPMEKDHYIEWIYLETNHGGQIKYLKPETDAMATFLLVDEKPKTVYAYCNLHGLWKQDLS